jgi:outer membrane protein assembly factor BamB
MKKSDHLRRIVSCLLFPALIVLSSCTSNWPQFRGGESNLVVSGKNLPDTWGAELNIRWATDIDGDSWASPVIWGNQVFIASAVLVKTAPTPEVQGAPPGPPQGEDLGFRDEVYRWEVSCFNLENGDLLWKQTAFEGSPRTKKHRATNYAPETPVTDGKRVYVYFGMVGLYCYNMDGEEVWEKDLGAFKTLNGWGTGSSPVLYKDRLFVQVDNEEQSFLVALDAASGEEVWKMDRDEKTNYSTPVIWKNSIRTELVTGGQTARSYDPLTGEVLWELEMAGYYNIPSPVFQEDLLYMGNTAFRDKPGTLFCIRAGAEGDITPANGESSSKGVLWSHPDAATSNPSPLLYKGLLYLVSGRGGEITCLKASSGELVYKEKLEKVAACWASPWACEDKIFFIDEKGLTRVIKAGESFEFLHQNELDDKFWASVAATRDAYILKGSSHLYCIGE